MTDERDYDLQIIVASGPEDLHRATLAFAIAVSAAVSGSRVVLFLAMRGTVWGTDSGTVREQQLPGFKSVAEYREILLEHGGRLEICSTCSDHACPIPVSRDQLFSKLEPAGLTGVAVRALKMPTLTF